MSDPTDPDHPGGARRTFVGPPTAWRRLGTLVLDWPRLTVALVLAVTAAAVAVSAFTLKIRPGYVELLSPRSPSQARYLDLLHEFGNVESLYVVVQSEDEASAAAVVDRLGPAIAELKDEAGAPRAAAVLWHVDRSWFLDRLPAYLPAAVLERISGADADRAAALVRDPAPPALLDAVGRALDAASAAPAASAAADADARRGLEGLTGLVREMTAAARGEPASLSRWLEEQALQAPGGSAEGLDAEGRIRLGPGAFLVTVRSTNLDNDATVMRGLVEGVRHAAADASRGLPRPVRVRLTGAPALLVDEMRAATWDMTWTTGVSFALVCVLFVVSFASMRHVLHAAITLGCGLALTFGAAWVLVGYLNLFSAVFGSILVGLGIDYGIHVVTHYETLRRAGATARDALMDAFEVVGPATTVGASANAAAFFAIMLSEFRGFSQLGLISGAGLLLCLVATFTLLPALLLLSARGRSAKDDAGRLYRHDRRPWSWAVVQVPLRWPRATLLGGAAALLLCLLRLPALGFDYNLLNLQPAGTDAAALAEGEGPLRVSTHLAHVVVGSLEEARRLSRRLERLPSVASVRSAASLLPEDLEAKRPALAAVAERLRGVAGSGPRVPVDAGATAAAAASLRAKAQALQDLAFEGRRTGVVQAFDGLLSALQELETACASPAAAAGLAAFRDASADLLSRMVAELPELAAGRGVAPADLPPALSAAFVGRTGRLALVVEPRKPVWDRHALEEFVGELRSVDGRVTGPPVQILDVMDTMRRSCVQAAWVSLAAILVIVGVGFRHAGGVLLALAPVVAGFVAMLGLMAWLGLPLNPANLIALPIILGSGVDNGVPMVHRWLQRRDAFVAAGEVGHAILVCALESLTGFGSLVLASHRGVRSFGLVTCIGAVAMVLTALWLLPAVLVLVDRRRGRDVTRSAA